MNGDTITADASRAIKGLADLEKKVGRQYTRKALRAACKVTKAAAIADAPERSGLTKSSIKVRSGGSRKGVIRMNVGVGKGWFKGPTFYAAFDLFGHKVGSRKLGDARKVVPPNNWLERAYNTTKSEAVDVFKETIASLISEGS